MSTATMNGTDAVKPSPASNMSGPKQQAKGGAGGKALDSARKQAASPVDGQTRKQQSPQPKAWQGHNPITQRASASSQPNGTEKPLPRAPNQSQSKTKPDAHTDKHAHDRLVWIVANFTGMDATLTLKNGEQFAGIFSGASLEAAKAQYTMKMVKRTRNAGQQQSNGVNECSDEYIGEGEDHTVSFDIQDTVDLFVPEVVAAQAQPTQNGNIGGAFRTDTEISSREARTSRERELQRWDAGDDTGIDMSLDASGATGWDQFATNESKYGVQSTYDENIYTTAIDRSDPNYRQKEAEAARIAREIEGSAPTNSHVAEERRQNAARDDGRDEEEKYSGVRREFVPLPKGAAGSYVPPSRRPITNTPTVTGAPYDPAIISSQLAKPSPTPEQSERPSEPPKPADVPQQVDEAKAKSNDTVPQVAAPAPEPMKKTNDNTAEDHVRGATDAFKQFANSEKLRIRQAQEQKRTNARNEKNVRLNDLKKFSLNFQLKSRVPDDLVPILAKDREKQVEIQRKAEDAARLAEERKTQEKERAESESPAPTSNTSVAATGGSSSSSSVPQQFQHKPRLSRDVRGPGAGAGAQSPFGAPVPRVPSGRNFIRGPGMPAIAPLPESITNKIAPAPLNTQAQVPPGPADPLSPSKRLNAGAFEFKPSGFQPSGASPSPQRKQSVAEVVTSPAVADFWGKKKLTDDKDMKDIQDGSAFNVTVGLLNAEYTEEQKKKFASSGGVPLPYMTPPTWTVPTERINTSYLDVFPKSQAPSHTPSPMHTPNPNNQMPHAHQLPPQLQAPHLTPQQQRFYPHGQQGHMDPRMQFGSNGSVQNSPRFNQAQMAFGNQMQQMPMQNFGGGQPGYMPSPSMGQRQMHMPPNAPMMMMQPQSYGQMPPMQQGQYPNRQFQGNMPQMGGQMMVPSHSSSGPYMNGPGGPQQSYSPMPHHPQPHMQHMQQPGGPGGYNGSPGPRPPMMQHGNSHQGYPPPHMPMQPGFPPPSPYHQPQHHYPQQRQLSNQGYHPQMTPRQQAAVPQHVPSPGQMGGVPGSDEGK